jgi:hypothetical protein
MLSISVEYKDIIVDKDEAIDLLHTFDNDEIHTAALMIKGRSLFSEHIAAEDCAITKSLLERPPVEDVETILEDYYVPPAQDSLRSAFALGYIVSRMVWITDERFGSKPLRVPVLTPRETYNLIERRHNDGRIEWLVRMNGDVEPSTEHMVFFIPFCKPSSGKHNSIISPTKKHSEWISQLYEMQVLAHKQRSHPPYVYEALPPSASSLIELTTANPTLINSMGDDGKARQATAFDQMALAASMRQALGKRDDSVLTDGHEQGAKRVKFEPTVVDNTHYIPEGYKAANPQPPISEPQQDLLNYHADFKEHALALHGIPPSIILSGARNNSQTSTNVVDDNDFVCFQRTLRIDAKWICKMIQMWYMRSYEQPPIRSDLKFYLKMVPFTTPGAIQRMHDQDIIHSKAQKEHLIALNGLHLSDMTEESNDIKRPPIGGNENQTTLLIKSKHDVQRAEERKLLAEAKLLEQQQNENGNEIKLAKLKIELEELKIKGQLEILEAQLHFEKEKLKVTKTQTDLKIKAAKNVKSKD